MKKFLTIALFIALAATIPLTVYLVQKGTQTRSEATFDMPISLINDSVGSQIPGGTTEINGPPKVTLVWPFIGKVGDAVALYGENFGVNAEDAVIFFGDTNVPSENIVEWTNNRIYFMIPDVPSGQLSAPITFMKVGVSSSWEEPFIVYDLGTKMQVTKPGDSVMTNNIPETYSVEIYLDDGSILYARPGSSTKIPPIRTVLTVVVKDNAGSPQPFYVEPIDFGF